MDMSSGDPDDIATALYFAFGLVVAGFLLLCPVSRSSVVGATFDSKPGVRQRPERGGEIIQPFLEQNAGHSVNHLAFQTDLDRGGPVMLAVLGVDRNDGMNQLMYEDTQHLSGLIEIGADENLEMFISRCGGVPALTNAIAFTPGRRKSYGKADFVGQLIALHCEVRP